MHWGHAVSSDYLRWRHLPVFLFPSEELTARPDKRGGAFSGSAIAAVDGPGIRVFFTEQVLERRPEQQIQLSALSPDLILMLGDYPAAGRIAWKRVPLPEFARLAAGEPGVLQAMLEFGA